MACGVYIYQMWAGDKTFMNLRGGKMLNALRSVNHNPLCKERRKGWYAVYSLLSSSCLSRRLSHMGLKETLTVTM